MVKLLSSINDMRDTIDDIWGTLRQLGVIRSLNRLYSVKGFEKGAAAFIPVLELINDWKAGCIEHWLNVNKAQKDLYDASLVLIWKIHHAFKAPSISKSLSAMAEIVKTGEILKRYEILDFQTCEKWADQLGSMTLFQHPMTQNFLIRPHRSFYLLHSLCEVKAAFTPPIQQTQASKREQLLKTVFHVGMIAIILTENYVKKGTAKGVVVLFRLLEIGTHSTSLIQFLIK